MKIIRINKKKLYISLFLMSLTLIFFSVIKNENVLENNTSISKSNTLLEVQTAYAQSVDVAKYSQPPYNLPTPNGDSDTTYSDEAIANFNTLGNAVSKNQTYLQSKFDAKYLDPFLSVIWVGAIEGTAGNAYSWNCKDRRKNGLDDHPNLGCSGGYYSGGWQVGYGIQVAQVSGHLVEDFNAAYGNGKADDANFVKEIGQKVLDGSTNSPAGKITNPSSFPAKTISSIVQEADAGNEASQQLIAVLLMDPPLGSIAIALEIAGDIASRDDWKNTMIGWDSPPDSLYYTNNMQSFSNRMKAIAERYTGEGGNIGGGVTGSFTLGLVLKPTTDNVFVINTATARAVGGGSGTNPPGGGNDGPVNPNASCPGAGPISCGSLKDGCHCSASYQANVTGCNGACSWCQPPDDSSKFAVDISNDVDAPVYIPKISVNGEARTITCKGYDNQSGSMEPNQIIQIVSCADDVTDEAIWMQFHHSKKSNPVAKDATYISGQIIGYSAAMEAFAAPPHVHFQMGKGGPCGYGGTQGCVEPSQYVQCNG